MTNQATQCELCSTESSQTNLSEYEVFSNNENISENMILICETCKSNLEDQAMTPNHWYCLRETIWSEKPAVKVQAWRILNKLSSQSFAQDLLDQIYLEDELLDWAKAESQNSAQDALPEARDSNGTPLLAGDTVSLIKDLEVKGAGFTAKRGTIVKNISLTEDPELIEGKINGTRIVLKTCFLKKSNA